MTTRTPYLLALDIGTSSIGYVVFGINDAEEPTSILDLGVRIFPDGREPKTKEPLAVGRRNARGIRRNRDRGQNRVRRLVNELIEFELLPQNEQERKEVFDNYCPYESRHKAASETVDRHTLGRALFHLGRRRGFRSNRLAGDAEESEYKDKINQLRATLGEQTLGTYLYEKLQENHHLANAKKPSQQKVVRFRNGETEFYADRAMYQREFDHIRDKQGDTLLSDAQWDAIEETVFWQYPLKPVPKGKCRFYPEETRAPADLPLAHDYRIYQEVNNLRYTSQGNEHHLEERQRLMVYNLLQNQKSLTFKGLLKQKDANKSPYFPSDARFNLDTPSRKGKLVGNTVMCDLRKPDFMGDLADQLGTETLNDIIEYLIEPLIEKDGKTVVMESHELEAWLAHKLPQLSAAQVSKLCKTRFKRDTASVSRKFMAQIVPVLRDTGVVYSEAVSLLEDASGQNFHHSHFETGEVLNLLPYYGKVIPESVWGERPEADTNKSPADRDEDAYQYGKIANPTVHVALNQLRVVVNRVIERIGNTPDKIHVELTRDLKNSRQAREEMDKQNAKNRKENDRIRKFLRDELNIPNPDRTGLQKIKLWEELGKQGARHCVFTGRAISQSQLFNEVEIEHIIPFSRCYDDGMNNKTLAFKTINNVKGKRTPHEAWGNDPAAYNSMMQRALTSFGQGSKYNRFKEDAYESFYGDDKGGDMIARTLNDTKYISRKAAQYLGCLCTKNNVVSVNGRLTAALRDVWQLNQFKDRAAGHYRDDHRHHIVDAFVVGLTSRSLIQQINRLTSQTQTPHKETLYHFLKTRVEPIPQLKQELFSQLNNVTASYKPDHGLNGGMFNDTAYGFGRDEYGDDVCITSKAIESLSFEEVFRIRSKNQRQAIFAYLTGGRTISSDSTQIRTLTSELKTYFDTGKKGEKQLADKLAAYGEQTGVKKLRLNVLNNSVRPIPSAPQKGYALGEYAYCDVWQIPTKKSKKTGEWEYRYQGAFVSYGEVNEYRQQPKRPVEKNGRCHPAAKRLMRLFKDDNIRITNEKTEVSEVLRVAGYSTSQNMLDLRSNLEAVNSGQNFKSINSLFGDYRVTKLRG